MKHKFFTRSFYTVFGVLILFFVLKGLAVPVKAAIPQIERDALIAFYNALNGDNWTDNSNWRLPGDPTQFNVPGSENTWFGITLTADEAHVESISYTSNNLNGTLPAELNDLTHLKTLKVQYGSNITGPIPDLSSLSQLEFLILEFTSNIDGSLPTWLNSLINLKEISFLENNLSGTIPDLSNLTQLTKLVLTNNNITGNLPASLNSLVNLKELSIRSNYLEGPLPDLSSLTQLETLWLASNNLSGSLPAWFNNLTSLKSVELNNNQFSGQFPDLSSLTQLTRFQLSFNNFEGPIPDLSNCTALAYIDLGGNNLTGSIPAWLDNLTNLIWLELQSNDLSGEIPYLGSLTKLKWLYLYANQLTGSIPASIGDLTALTDLRLFLNKLSGGLPPELGNLPNIEYIKLYGNKITGEIPPSISNLTSLKNAAGLNISYNGLYTDDSSLISFLNSKQSTWSDTQTIAPVNLAVANFDETTVQLTWDPIQYQGATGGYKIYSSTTSGSGYSLAGTLADKSLAGYTVTGLEPDTDYYFVVTAYTDPHSNNINTVTSGYSPEVSATTAGGPPSITVVSPNGGEVWQGESVHDITWTSQGAIENVKIEYSDTGGFLWFTIIESTPNTGSYSWTLPNWDSTTCLVKVSNLDGPESDESDYDFTVLGPLSLMVLEPNGGESLEAGKHHYIHVYISGTNDVKAEYSINNGVTWNIINESVPNVDYIGWVVPNTPSTQCLVKITDNTGELSDTSDAVFTIEPPKSISVTAPNGGEIWEMGTVQNITWASTGNITDVKIERSINNGLSWSTVTTSTPNDGSFSWTVPNTTASSNWLIRITDANGTASDTSDAVFSIIVAKTITLTAPNGGENWVETSSQNITWTYTGSISQVKIEYSTNSGGSWDIVTASTANTGTYNWTIPNTLSTACLVKVSDASGTANDTSDAVFTISQFKSITVTSPNGGEDWEVGSTHTITWTTVGDIANVKIEYDVIGTDYITIVESTPNTGSYDWTVPNYPSSVCWIRISDVVDSSIRDTNNSGFVISYQKSITIWTPDGGEYLVGGSTYDITWGTTGSIGTVTIEYTTDNGGTWNNIYAMAANDGSHTWTVPMVNSTSCKVRITHYGGTVSDTSNAVFTITEPHSFVLHTPNGGENWKAGTTQTITWSSSGLIYWVKLQYSTDGGAVWKTITSSTSNDGSYDWVVPNEPSMNCLIQITEFVIDPASDTCDAPFTISEDKSITVMTPNGGENWEAESTETITWSSFGSITDVKIEYSIDNGASWSTVIASTANTGSYNWTIPDTPSTDCLVKISDASAVPSGGDDTSNQVFTIREPVDPFIDLVSPNGGELWGAGSPHNITWSSSGFSSVTLEYSSDAGTNWSFIATGISDTGSYSWLVPEDPSTTCLVRISEDTGTYTDTSSSYFIIDVPPAQYCSSSGNSQSYEWIAGVYLGNLSNPSSSSKYSDYTDLTANLTPGASVSFTLNPGFRYGSYSEYWKIWIDYNKDGDFDDVGEQVYSGVSRYTINSSFTVSASATGTTRMRVSMRYGGYPPTCGSFTYGEVEDYTVIFQ